MTDVWLVCIQQSLIDDAINHFRVSVPMFQTEVCNILNTLNIHCDSHISQTL